MCSQDTRESFFDDVNGLSLEAIEKCEHELQRLKDLKKAKMQVCEGGRTARGVWGSSGEEAVAVVVLVLLVVVVVMDQLRRISKAERPPFVIQFPRFHRGTHTPLGAN
jgi:hypothetical protein